MRDAEAVTVEEGEVPASGGPRGVTVSDAVGLVVGAAVASVHLRDVLTRHLSGPGWVLVAFAFAWVGMSAAGPAVALGRRRHAGRARIGEGIWAWLGMPWVVAAVPRSLAGAGPDPFWQMCLAALIPVASSVALVRLWRGWVKASRDPGNGPPAPWTEAVGLTLGVAWPLQWGLGLVAAS